MNVREIAGALSLRAFSEAEPERGVKGCYTGDLLSWVMGRAKAGQAWVTIMSNVNVVAVAALTDVAVVILSENVEPDADALEAARRRGVNLSGSELPSYDLLLRLSEFV